MAEAKIELSGTQGLIAVVVIIAYVIISILSWGEDKDPELREAVQLELQNELAGMVQHAKLSYNPNDEESAQAYLDATNTENIAIHSIYVSKPLLSFSSDQKAVVKVEFTLPGAGQVKQTKYFRFKHGLIGGWRAGLESTSFAFYSNFF